MKNLKKISQGLLLMSVLWLTACASQPQELESPCDAFGQHCDPKVPINQWTKVQNNNC